MVVNHSPAVFCFCPDGCEPARTVGSASARQDVLPRNERVFLAEHPHDDVFVAQHLRGLPVFPETFAHSFLNRFDAARRTGRKHLGRFLHISRKILIKVALVPTLGSHLKHRPNRLLILALPKPNRRADRANNNQQKYRFSHNSPFHKFPILRATAAKGFAPKPKPDKINHKNFPAPAIVIRAVAIVNLAVVIVNRAPLIINPAVAIVNYTVHKVNRALCIVKAAPHKVNRTAHIVNRAVSSVNAAYCKIFCDCARVMKVLLRNSGLILFGLSIWTTFAVCFLKS